MAITINTPLTLGNKTLANRLVMPPLVIWQSDLSGKVTGNHRIHYGRTTGAGYTIVEATCVSPEGRLSASQLGIWDDSHIAGLSELAKIIKSSGSLAGIQIHHAGGKAKREFDGLQPLVPDVSVYPEDYDAHMMTEEDIQGVVKAFSDGAERAVRAGFDVIELHGAHGYLISQFLSPQKNRRTDKYGGSPENRRRFLREVALAVKLAIRDRALLSIRLGVADDPLPEGEPFLSLEEGVDAARMMEELGAAILNISCAHGADPALKPEGSPWSSLMHHAMAVKRAVSLPVIGVGDIKDPRRAEELLAEEAVDMVAVGKGVLADPAWFRSASAGKPVTLCRGCRRCLWFKRDKINFCPAWKDRGETPFP